MYKRVGITLQYHTESKHHNYRYAQGPHALDFSNQPMPFSRYSGAPVVPLPLLKTDPEGTLLDLYEHTATAPSPFTLCNVGALLELSLGIAAWKSYNGNSWALRINPSSGNLHPTEAHLLLPPTKDETTSGSETAGGLYHYTPYTHSLERRILFDTALNSSIGKLLNDDGFVIGLTSIYWREAWKYGVRAWRYCSLDLGHAIAAISFAASLLGWKAHYLENIPDKEASRLLGLDRTKWHNNEEEEFEALLHICPATTSTESASYRPPDLLQIVERVAGLEIAGTPDLLSAEQILWDGIEEVSKATSKVDATDTAKSNRLNKASKQPYLLYPNFPPNFPKETGAGEEPKAELESIVNKDAAESIRCRRSAQAFDPFTGLDSNTFFAMLDRTVPRVGNAPFDALETAAEINLLLFVHRVGGLKRGLYMLVRNSNDLEGLRRSCPSGLWLTPEGAPTELGLYLLKEGDFRETAAGLSCMQDIAGESAFSLGMLARVRERVTEEPHFYRRLFWEAGIIGQVLYLEATSIGMSGTGIGCFFDETVQEVAELTDDTFESIYHFTVGRAIEDERLQTMAPYQHLQTKE